MLVILNMVIAVMGSTFERVEETADAEVLRSKLKLIIGNYYRFSDDMKYELQAYKYLLAVDVDPDVDPIEKDSMEKRLTGRMESIDTRLDLLSVQLGRVCLNQDTLYDNLCSVETKKNKS